jgi:hypothetical protein
VIDAAARQAPWYLGSDATNDAATRCLDSVGRVAGAFVVRKSQSIDNAYILCYA